MAYKAGRIFCCFFLDNGYDNIAIVIKKWKVLTGPFNTLLYYTDTREKMSDSLHDFVFLSEPSARANLIRIASGRNTENPANPWP